MGYKSRSGFAVEECIGCIDVKSERCQHCLGRPQDKRRASEEKETMSEEKQEVAREKT